MQDTNRNDYIMRYWRTACLVCLFLSGVGTFADLGYARPNHLGTVLAARFGLNFTFVLLLLVSYLLKKERFHQIKEILFTVLLQSVSLSMGILEILTGGPETLYFMGMAEAALVLLIFGKVRPWILGANLFLSLFVYSSLLLYGLNAALYEGKNTVSAVLISLILYYIILFILNRVNFAIQVAREKAENFNLHILNSIGEAFISLDSEERIVYSNGPARELMKKIGKNYAGILDRPYAELFPPRENPLLYQCIKSVYRTENPREVEERITDLDKHFQIKITPNGEGGVSLLLNDITELVTKNEMLQAAKEKAEQANQAKTDFLDAVNHDLRTPLSIVNANAELIEMDLETNDLESIVQRTQEIRQTIDYQTRLIADLLDSSAIESGKMTVDINQTALFLEVLELLRANTDPEILNMLTLENEADKKDLESLELRGEKNRIFQVLENVCKNAKKYSQDGQVVYSLNIEKDMAVLRVINKVGVNIEPEYLFEKFKRFHSTGEGYGLGLANVKNIMEQLDGFIAIDEQRLRSKGEFLVELGFPRAVASREPAKNSP